MAHRVPSARSCSCQKFWVTDPAFFAARATALAATHFQDPKEIPHRSGIPTASPNVIVVIPNRCGNSSGLASCVGVIHKRQNCHRCARIGIGSCCHPARKRDSQHSTLLHGTQHRCTGKRRTVRRRTAAGRGLRFKKAHKFVDLLLWDGLQAPGRTCLSAKRELVLWFPRQESTPFPLGLSSKRGLLRFGAQTSAVRSSAKFSTVQCSVHCFAQGLASRWITSPAACSSTPVFSRI